MRGTRDPHIALGFKKNDRVVRGAGQLHSANDGSNGWLGQGWQQRPVGRIRAQQLSGRVHGLRARGHSGWSSFPRPAKLPKRSSALREAGCCSDGGTVAPGSAADWTRPWRGLGRPAAGAIRPSFQAVWIPVKPDSVRTAGCGAAEPLALSWTTPPWRRRPSQSLTQAPTSHLASRVPHTHARPHACTGAHTRDQARSHVFPRAHASMGSCREGG